MRSFRIVRISLLLGAFAVAAAAVAAPIDRKVVVQPILAAMNDGSNVVDFVAYEAFANKIFAQAGIMFEFLPSFQLNDSDYYTFDANNAIPLVTAPGKGQSANPLVINAFFANTITNESVFGFAYPDQPYAVFDVASIKGFSALGRVDTFSHEIGHNLMLEHTNEPVGFPGTPNVDEYLMASGDVRTVPQALGDVFPDGLGLDKLLPEEIAIMRRSKFAQPVPEPATLAALGLGLAAACRRRRRRKA